MTPAHRARRPRRRLCATVVVVVAVLSSTAGMLVGVRPASAALEAVGPTMRVGPPDQLSNFPEWYQDENLLRLELCLEGPPLCLTSNDEMVAAQDGEAFWWQGEADLSDKVAPAVVRNRDGTASQLSTKSLLVMAVEAAFAGEEPGMEAGFNRIRIRINTPRKGEYRVTYPYGTRVFRVDEDPTDGFEINFTEDIGCFGTPQNTCYDGVAPDFDEALAGQVGPFLVWDPAVAPAPPPGYVGDPEVEHPVVGSPNGQNVFRIEGPGIGGRDATGREIDVVETRLFSIQGKIARGTSTPDMTAATDSGASSTDDVTNVARPTFTGNATPDAPVHLYVDGVRNGSTRATAAGVYSVTPATPIADGVHRVTATEVNGGTESRHSAPLTITVDTVAPVAPQVRSTAPASPAASPRPAVSGAAEAGSHVRLFGNATCSSAAAATGTAAAFASPGITVTVPANSTTTFRATATDLAGNASACSSTSVTYVSDSAPPSVPAGVTATAVGDSQINVSWNASSDDLSGVRAYRVYRDGGAAPLASVTGTSYGDIGLTPGSTHTYEVQAVDEAGNASARSAPVEATTGGGGGGGGDVTPPGAPSALSATPVSPSQVDLSWNASTDDVGVVGYRIYRDRLAAPVGTATGTTFSDTGLAARTTYSYAVSAVDAAGNESPRSSAASATTPGAPDTTAPSAPTGLSATAVSSSRIDLSWTASTDDVGVTGYVVLRDGAPVTTVTTGTAFADTGRAPGATHTYQVAAVDAAGNHSALSNSASATTPAAPDAQPPAPPTALTATVLNANQIRLSWGAATDDVGVSGYRIFRNGGATPVATVAGSATTHIDGGLAPESTHSYTVVAFDGAGNVSAASNTATATTLAAITVDPAAFNYGNVSIVLRARTQGFTVRNNTLLGAGVPGIAVSGTHAADFRIASNGCAGRTLGGGANCSYSITFDPSSTGPRTARVTVTTAIGTVVVQLQGNGTLL